jgi:hypothetical protein
MSQVYDVATENMTPTSGTTSVAGALANVPSVGCAGWKDWEASAIVRIQEEYTLGKD